MMALVKTSPEIIEIRGQFGGVYFKKDNSGQHVQAMPRSIRKISMRRPLIAPESPGGSRATFIRSWTIIAGFYVFMIACVYFPLWLYKQAFEPFPKGKAKGKKLPPYAWWMHYNVTREAQSLPIYWRPPKSSGNLPDLTAAGNYWSLLDQAGQPIRQRDTLMFYKRGYGETYNGKPYYLSDGYNKVLWWDGAQWVLSGGIEEYPLHHWTSVGPEVTGIYTPNNPPDDIVFVTT